MIRVTPKLCASAAALLLCVSGSAVAQDDGPTTTYKFGGYAKFDAMFSDYSGGAPTGSPLIRQFYFPAQIPLGDAASDDITADFQARETRINFRADTKTAGGDSITAFIDPKGNRRTYSYDDLQRMVHVQDPNAGEIGYTYDDVGNRIALVDQRGAQTTWTYDDLDRVRTETQIERDPLETFTSTFDYDDLTRAIDYVSGMTDRFALQEWERLCPPDDRARAG